MISQPETLRDLSFYQGKIYIFWSPFIALLITPLVFIFGLNFPDTLYAAFFGGVNCGLFYLFLKNLSREKIIKLTNNACLWATIFFGFGTVHFSLSVIGHVWYTAQVISLTFFLLSLIFMLRQKLFASGLFFALAGFSRQTFFLSLPFFLSLFFIFKKEKKIAYFVLPIIFLALIYGYYNFLRFGNFLTTGFNLQAENFTLGERFYQPFLQYGLINIHYLPGNFYYLFLNPLNFKPQLPFINPNPEGNSLFFISPLFIYLFYNCQALFKSPKTKIFNLGILISVILMLIPVLLNIGTGWFQFGCRYLLDITPFLIIIILQTSKNFHSNLAKLLLLISCFINIMAYFWWQGINL